MTDFIRSLTAGDVLTFFGVIITAGVIVWRQHRSDKVIRVILHQTNSMVDEMQQSSRREGRAEGLAQGRREINDGAK